MAKSNSVYCWLQELRYETESYEVATTTIRTNSNRVSWSPIATRLFINNHNSNNNNATIVTGETAKESENDEDDSEIKKELVRIRPRLQTGFAATDRSRKNQFMEMDENNRRKTCSNSSNQQLPMRVIQEGALDRVKLKKNWRLNMYGLLTDHALFFIENKDQMLDMKSGIGAAVSKDRIDLRGCTIMKDLDRSHSAKKNVLVITTSGNGVLLIQNDDLQKCDSWFKQINEVVTHLNRGKIVQSSGARSALSRFFKKRPAKETLVNQGIYKSEQIFGNSLQRLYESTQQPVPPFVQRCTDILENPPHIFSIGLYRTSGNLSHIQRLRLRVDQEDSKVLDDPSVSTDSDVLAGALKLFFRELQHPLIPYQIYIELSLLLISESDAVLAIKETLRKKLPQSHRLTLGCLCKHLLRITECEKQNQMSTANLAIVWGPSFTWPDEGAGPRALHQCTDVNRVVQYLIEQSFILF